MPANANSIAGSQIQAVADGERAILVAAESLSFDARVKLKLKLGAKTIVGIGNHGSTKSRANRGFSHFSEWNKIDRTGNKSWL